MTAVTEHKPDRRIQARRGVVVLVHGFNKKGRDMRDLADALERKGWTCLRVNLPTLFGDQETCVAYLRHQVCTHLNHTNTALSCKLSVHFVAHSLGGLIVRRFIAQHWQSQTQTLALPLEAEGSCQHWRVGHCVFIATPHKGSRLADIAVRVPGYQRTFKPIAALLPGAGYQPLPRRRNFNLGLIAGEQSKGLFSRLLQQPNDGQVELASVKSCDADAMQVLPYHHKNIHHQLKTVELTHKFLVAGAW